MDTPINYLRRLWMMLAALAVVVGAALLFNFLVNPFGAWHHRLVSGIYYRVRAGHDRVIAPYLLRGTQPSTVMFGTSRVLMGIPIEQGYKDGYLNAAMAAAKLPEIAKGVKLALKNPHLKRVIWGLDFFSFNVSLDSNADTTARLGGDLRLLILDNLLSAEALDSSYHLLDRAFSGRRKLDQKVLEPIPWPADFICERFARYAQRGLPSYGERGALQQSQLDVPLYRGWPCCEGGMAEFSNSLNRIRRAGVETIIFIPPLSQYELEAIRQGGMWPQYQEWKRDLTSVTPYWDFSGYNQIARTDTMFLDILHVKPEAGMTILRRLLGEADPKCEAMKIVLDSGLWMDSKDVDQMLAVQDRREQAAIAQTTKYEEVVKRAIEQGGHNLTSASR